MASLRLSSGPQGGCLVVAVEGDLDIVTSREFDDYLTKARRDHRRLVIDLSAVSFMDTSSLAVIVGHWKKLTAEGGALALAGARYRHTKTLWITGLAHRLPLFGTAAEAAAALTAGGGTPGASPGGTGTRSGATPGGARAGGTRGGGTRGGAGTPGGAAGSTIAVTGDEVPGGPGGGHPTGG